MFKLNYIKKNSNSQYFLSFLIPFLVTILVYIAVHITPFGDNSLAISDAKALYMSDLAYIKRLLLGKEDPLYSFEQGIGLNLMGTHSGLLNPANLIVLFFDIVYFTDMFSWLIAIDIAICGLTMFIFLSVSYGKQNHNLIFSTLYALIGFNVAFCFNYNFFLSVELLPLIALGIRRIVSGKSPWLYLITLSYSILASFYFGYMLCIASFILFLMYYFESKEKKSVKVILYNYFGASLVAGLIPAVIWLPTLLSFSGGRMEQNSLLDFTMAENMSVSDVLAKLFIGANNINELIDGQPNVYCGILAVFLSIVYFLDRSNTRRMKICRAVPLVFYFITFYVNALSMAMQGFSTTNWFNYRYSFVFSFMLIVIAFEEFTKMRTINAVDFKKSCAAFVALVILVFSQRYSFVSGGWMLLSVLILACCLGAIWWNRINQKKAPTQVMVSMLILLCAIEGYANFTICINNILSWTYSVKEYQEELFYGSVEAESITKADSDFYRIANEHQTNQRANNDPRLYGYDGLNYFGSCEQTFVFKSMSRLGMNWLTNRMWYSEGEPVAFDSLFGIKYIIARRDLLTEKQYKVAAVVEKDTIYRNEFALPIAIISNSEIASVFLDRNPFQNHNAIWKSMTGQSEDVFIPEQSLSFTYHESNDGSSFSYENAQDYSTSLANQETSAVKMSASGSSADNQNNESNMTIESIIDSGKYIECTFTAQRDGSIYSYLSSAVDDTYGYCYEPMRYIGDFKQGDVVTDYIPVSGDMTQSTLKGICAEYYVAYENDNTLKNYCAILQEESGSLEKLTDSHLRGVISPTRDSRILFTIPYDEGWTLRIDGNEVPLEKTADLFMSAPVSKGEHSYEMVFFPRGMKTGLYISCGAVVLLLILVLYNVRGKHSESLIEVQKVQSFADSNNVEEPDLAMCENLGAVDIEE